MLAAVVWILFIVGIFALAFYRASFKNWCTISAVLLALLTPFLADFFKIFFWCCWLLLTILLLIRPLRIKLFTKPLLGWFRRQQPELSSSERDVLAAGGVWFEGQFFSGKPDWSQFLHAQPYEFSPEEKDFLANEVEQFCALLDEWKIVTKDNDLSTQAWDFIKEKRLWGLTIEKEYGGYGFSALAHSAIVAKIASRSFSAAMNIMVPNSLGPATFLELYGTDEQKSLYLPKLATGEEIGCFALTSLEAGSDASHLPDKGVVCYGTYQGEKVLGIRLDFDKRYITLAPIATLIGLAFHLYDPDGLLGDKKDIGMTCAYLPANFAGIDIGERHQPLNLSFMNGPIVGRDVFIPMSFVFGGVDRCGHGWKMLLECLSLGRGISLPALASAATKVCFRMTGAYAQVRQQFSRPIGAFEGVAKSLARIGGLTYLTDAVRLFTAEGVDAGARPSIASAIAKYHLTEFSRQAVNDAMDIHAGRGIQMGPRNYLANLYNAMPIGITVEGANILTRNLIIFGQGLLRCHPYLAREMEASERPQDKEQLRKFDRLLWAHVGFTISSFVKSFVFGITGGHGIRAGISRQYPQHLQLYLKQLTRMSNALALVTDITLLILGSKLKLKESLSARLGDVVSNLYLASAVIKRCIHDGNKEEDWPFARWSLDFCLYRIQQAFDGLFNNYPRRRLGRFLRRLIFPWGRSYAQPQDEVFFAVAKKMQQDSPLRDRLTNNCYIGDEEEAIGIMEQAFSAMQKVAPLLKKVLNGSGQHYQVMLERLEQALAAGEITQEQNEQIKRALMLQKEAIEVDQFKTRRESE